MEGTQSKHFRRSAKLLTLLLTSLLIGTASAAVYNYLYMDVTPVKVYKAKVCFDEGDDATAAGVTIGTNQTYAEVRSLSGWPNATRVYEDPARINNTDTTKSFTIELKVNSYTGDKTQVDSFVIKLIDTVEGQKGTLTVTAAGDTTGALTIDSSEIWRLQFEIKWKAGARPSHQVQLVLELTVTGEGTGE